MNPRNAAELYRTASIENAPPIKIVRLLYEGALRFLDQASNQDANDPTSRFVELVGKVDDIVVELRLALDGGPAPELASNLERLYLFCEDRLGQSLVERSPQPLAEVRRVLEILLDAWRQVEVQSNQAA